MNVDQPSDGPDEQVALVGANPLPLLRSVCTVQPPVVVLVHSAGTEGPARRLEDAIKVTVGSHVRRVALASAWAAQEVGSACESVLTKRSWLDYTGGTKVMAAHARLALDRVVGDAAAAARRASYVHEAQQSLQFDDGTTLKLAPVPSLGNLLGLHGIEVLTQRTGQEDEDDARYPGARDAWEVARAAIRDLHVLTDLHKALHSRSPTTLARQPVPLPSALHGLRVQRIPDSGDWDVDCVARWRAFLTGGWLEQLFSDALRQAAPDASVAINVHCVRGGREFEVDAVALHHGRLYVGSCATTPTITAVKEKSFELALRARQMGGDLGRGAVVTLLAGDDQKTSSPRVDAVQADLDELWGGPNRMLVRGRDHIARWSEGDVTDLADWMSVGHHS